MHKKPRPLSEKSMALIAAAIAAAVVFFAVSAPIFTAVTLSERITVVIDPGHGGADGGVTGRVSGVRESDLNLAVSAVLGEYLTAAGYRVIYTRTNKNGAYPDIFGTSFSKKEDMEKRARIISRAEPRAVVSIHMNYYSAPSRRGAQVFFGSSERGRAFAEIMQERLNMDINASGAGREYSALYAEKYILECAPPTVIVECGFLSNVLDERDLLSDEYRARLAYTIFQGIVIYLSSGRV